MNETQKIIKVVAIALAIFIIVAIVNGIIFGLRVLSGVEFSNEEGVHFEEKYNNVNQIDIDINASEIEIVSGSFLGVEANNVSSSFTSKNQNGKLKIEERKISFWNSNKSGKIIITVPKDKKLLELKVSSGAGKIQITDIISDKLDISQGAGVLKIDNSIFLDTKIDGGAGEITINSSTLQNLDLDAGVGEINLTADILGNSKIDCGVGEINLKLPHESDYYLSLEKGIGNIKINGRTISNDMTYGNGNNKIDIDGGIGSVNIDFQD